MGEKEQNSKIIGNAISAYLMIFISALFLTNKSNALLNNHFVKTHTKSALLIHFGFLITYIVFISYNIGAEISIGSFALNYIIASVLCICLLGILIYGIFQASKGNIFGIGDILKISKVENVLESSNEQGLSESEKLDIIISYIPFIGFLKYPSHKKNQYILNGSKGNLFITVIFILLFSFGYTNIATFLMLIYVIYVVFTAINLFTSNNIIQIRYPHVFSPEYKFNYTHALLRYFKNYIQGNNLEKVHYYLNEIQNENKKIDEIDNNNLLSFPDISLPKTLIYIPIINLLYLFTKKNKYTDHIINGTIISLLFIVTVIIIYLTPLSSNLLYLFAIIICYGIGYIHAQPIYKMPYIYMFYNIYKKITGKTKDFHNKYNVEKNETLTVEKK